MLYEDGTQAMSYSSLNSYARGYYVVVGETGRIEVPCNYNCRNIQKFGRCILSGEKPLVSKEETVLNAEILDRMFKSAK